MVFVFSKGFSAMLKMCLKNAFCFSLIFKTWVFPKIRGTPKWMVYNGKPIKMDDLGVNPIFGNIHMYLMNQ